MQPIHPESTDSDPPHGSDQADRVRKHRVVEKLLSAFKGWQVVPVFIIAVYLFLGIFGTSLAPFDPNRGTVSDRLCPPLAIDALTTAQYPASSSADCSAENILGTDHNGRDIFSRMLHGTRTSLLVVLPSVVIGTVIGAIVGAAINGWRPKPRFICYLIASVTIVPFGILLLAEPYALYVFGMFASAGDGVDWSALTSFSCASAVITLAIVAVAYRFDNSCRVGWPNYLDVEFSIHSYCRRFHAQIANLGPWIVFAGIASAALVFLRSGTTSLQTAAITWAYEPDYLFEHIGMFAPFVPTVLIPIAFVSLATWWGVRHVLGRLNPAQSTAPTTDYDAEVSSEDRLPGVSAPTEDNLDQLQSQTDDPERTETSPDVTPRNKILRWLPIVVAIVTAIVVIRFAVAEAVPIVRELVQDPSDGYQSAWSQTVQGRGEAITCANELSSRLMTLWSVPREQLDIDASQRCLDLYFQYRNAPSHRFTIDYALQFLPQTLTLALVAAIVSALMWNVSTASSRRIRLVIGICVLLTTLTGLTMTFGYAAWALAILQWFDPVDLVLHDTGIALSRALNVIRDFSVALGITYVTIAVLKPTIRFGKPLTKLEVFENWASWLIPCALLTSALLILFHYRFPVNLLFTDNSLGVIADPTPEQTYISTGLPIRNWLWTYWFAAIGYAAIVFAFIYAAVWGFRRYVRTDADSVGPTPAFNPNSPSQDADSI